MAKPIPLNPDALEVSTFQTSQPALYASASGESQCGEICTCYDICVPPVTNPSGQLGC